MTLSYDETRDNEQLRFLTTTTDAFIAQYQSMPASASSCARQTVFFFPGGMASQLLRASQKFVDGVASPAFSYDPVWIGLDTFLGGARNLEMHRDAAGTFRDKNDRIIVADGSISLIGCTPHDGLIAWCRNNNIDLFVYGWDWRRRLDDTVKFFLGKFLPFFRGRVMAAGLPDPLANFSLLGHSFGGMIVNLILRSNDPGIANLANAITVATPHYGYAGQMHRWFEGESLLNGPFNMFKRDIVRVVSSLPALYTLLFLDGATFDDVTVGPPLAAAPDFPLPAYPSMDATNAALRADPYNPQTNGALGRYPTTTGFDRAELDHGELQFRQLASPMSASQSSKYYNIRGVRTQADQQTPLSDTVGSVTWDWIDPHFDCFADASPIVDGGPVPGDDTQPAWSAHLATNAPARRRTVRASDIQHMFMMNHPQVLNEIGTILCAARTTVSPPASTEPEPASDQDVIDFLRWLYRHRTKVKRWPSLRDEKLLEIIPPELREKFPRIARRIMMDILKRPGPKGLSGPDRGPGGKNPRKPKGGPRGARSRARAARPRAAGRGRRKLPRKK